MTTVFPVGDGRREPSPPQRVLTVSAGESSIKVRLVEPVAEAVDPAGWRVVAAWDRAADDAAALGQIVEAVDDGRLLAVAHRVVAGGGGRSGAALVDEEVARKLVAASEVSPLESAPTLEALWACREASTAPQVACADSAFFATVPAVAATYAVPREWDRQLGARLVGRHGLSHAWADRRGRQLAGPGAHRVVTCHLGLTASLAAVADGRCVDTTSGFSGSDGLVAATRSGAVDPGLITYVQERLHWTPARMRHALERESGVAGLSGLSGDMALVLQAERLGHEPAALAVGVYLYRFRASVASMTAALGGVDVLVFTGEVAENNPDLVDRACRGLEFLGVPEPAGAPPQRGDRVTSPPGARVTVAVLASREDAQLATLASGLLDTAVLAG